MAVIFAGQKFALGRLERVEKDVLKIQKERGLTPCLASIYFSCDPASVLYTQLKKKKAKSVGIKFLDYEFAKVDLAALAALIEALNKDTSVHGVMLQKPVGKKIISKEDGQKLIALIAKDKDVDGMRKESLFVPPVVKAIGHALDEALKSTALQNKAKKKDLKMVVLGAAGFVGARVMKYLFQKGFRVEGYDLDTAGIKNKCLEADILICATGQPGLVKAKMVKKGAIIIDVGSPEGEVDFEGVRHKASFITPVPGGVGPVTIACLLENLTEASGGLY